MSSSTSTGAQMPTMPAPRAAHCPLAPPVEFAEWREMPGLQKVTNLFLGQPAWVASRYEDIRAALTDPRMSANTIPEAMTPTGEDNDAAVIFPRTDDPEHNRLRRMLTRDFTVRRAKEMAPEIQQLVDGFVDDMIAAGPPCDLVRDFALPVPSLVICLLLGVPYADHEYFQDHSTGALDVNTTEEQKVASIMTMFGYINELLERKKREPGNDLLTRLMLDNVAKGEMSVATVAMTGFIMLQAGHETTASMIALGTLVLLQAPGRDGHPARNRRSGGGAADRRRIVALPDHRAQRAGRPAGARGHGDQRAVGPQGRACGDESDGRQLRHLVRCRPRAL